MTDNEIINGLEHCSSNGECKDCPANPRVGNCGHCMNGLMKATLDLINRQKAEIERLRQANADICEAGGKLLRERKTIRDAIIKEFAERLSERAPHITEERFFILRDEIDNLVKEMTEETKHE